MDVAVDHQSFCRLVENGLETSLEQGTDPAVLTIQPDTIANIKPMDGLTQIGFRSLQLQMIMIAHQQVAVQLDTKAFSQTA